MIFLMKIALLADIHSNLEALQACLAHARERGATQFAFLGDLVGYGADPLSCLEIIAELSSRGAIAVLGNHDKAALGGLCVEMSFHARDSVYWTRQQLGEQERAFLSRLPAVVKQENRLYVHASAARPEAWTYITGAREATRSIEAGDTLFSFGGHVHHACLYFHFNGKTSAYQPAHGIAIPLSPHRRWFAIVGSVGQQRDGNNAAAYALFDPLKSELTFFRISYDYLSAARKIREAGLPERFARRLETG